MLRRRLFLLLAAGLVWPAAPAGAQTPAPTTVIVVRHAEKAEKPADDPGLSRKGLMRAEALADALEGAGITAIYATPLRRTRDTASPLADRLGLEIAVAEIGAGGVKAHVESLARLILERHRGGTVLVVGHSNTVPLLLRELGAGVPAMSEEDFDDLYILTIPPKGPRRLIRARYGPPN
jgi:broad specificity phosphatase PhoE